MTAAEANSASRCERHKSRSAGFDLSRPGPRRALVAAIIIIHLGLAILAVRHKSATSDEPYHLARGASHLFSGDFRMAVAHPPLINLITALPLRLFPGLQLPFGDELSDPADWHNTAKLDPANRKNRFAWMLLWVHDVPGWPGNHHPLAMIFAARCMAALLSAALALALYLFTARALGPRPGIAALVLYCLSPTVLGQAGLITTVIGGSLAIFIFAAALVRHLEAPTWTRLALCGVACGLAQLSNYTAILVLPLIPLVLLLAPSAPLAERARAFFTLDPRRPAFLTGVLAWPIILLITALVIWAGFGFELHSIHKFEVPPPAPISDFGAFAKGLIIRALAASHLPPKTYYFGLTRTLTDTALHSHPLFFLGGESTRGWWYYYPIEFAIKEPIALLALIALASIALPRRKIFPRPALTVFTVLGLGILGCFMFLNQKNIGIRHLIPIYPFIFFIVAGTFHPRLAATKWLQYAGTGLLVLYTINALASFPDYLAHFNYLVGGPDRGLTLSVVGDDWGQDLWALGDFCRERKLDSINYNPYGNSDPKAYWVPARKFDCTDLQPGWYAFHVVQLRRPERPEDEVCAAFFLPRKPYVILHHTVYVYQLASEDLKR
jgi:hypothetical protein